jgi:hypothetical protein
MAGSGGEAASLRRRQRGSVTGAIGCGGGWLWHRQRLHRSWRENIAAATAYRLAVEMRG